MMSVLSLYESSFNVSSSAIASSNAYNSVHMATALLQLHSAILNLIKICCRAVKLLIFNRVNCSK